MARLTKSDIDKVRDIEGFPIGRDEDIIALSRPPYYTACPNPFIEDFIRGHGAPYDEATDDYHREPFAADVSEGKNDPIYNAHSYHTKVPHKAIMRYILHYTRPGDIVFDGFCGTGMTGVAAQMCGCADADTKHKIEQEFVGGGYQKPEWGARKAILSDLSPIATFIAYNYNTPVDVLSFQKEAERILAETKKEYEWMYLTIHNTEGQYVSSDIMGNPIYGKINYIVWSDVFVCPSCSMEINFWDSAVDKDEQKVNKEFKCPYCGSVVTKQDCVRAKETHYDDLLRQTIQMSKQVPVMICYTYGNKKYYKSLDEYDYKLIDKINDTPIPFWVPTDELPYGYNTEQPKRSHGINHTHQFYTRRNLIILSSMYEKCTKSVMSEKLMIWFTSQLINISKLNRHRMGVSFPYNPLSGTLYISSMIEEANCFIAYENKLKKMTSAFRLIKSGENIISCQSSTSLNNISSCSVDYIFTDPPFGGNLNYSELSFIWESWLKIVTDNKKEAIVNEVQNKGIHEYAMLMEACFEHFYRMLKPSRWITVEFHNSKNAIWNAIQQSLLKAGFVVSDVRVLDKKQGSFKQVTTTSAVKQDLVISAYKPKESFVREFQEKGGDPDMAWAFVRQHLANVPVTAVSGRDGKLEVIAERQDYLLFDRMVAWHIMNGVPVPLDAHDFYAGLRERFIERDGMFFLPDQVSEYDEKKMRVGLEEQQLSFVVSNEKNAIEWLRYMLSQRPMTYQQIQPEYLQQVHQNKTERMPELLDMLEANFLQDDDGAWYIPDPARAADLAKLRRKTLLREFRDDYAKGSGKLKIFRMEAIRAGFDECWKQRDYDTIVRVGGRLPDSAFEDDAAILMYYDNACARAGKQP